ncbi:phospholipid scramblase 2-like isoform X7 [Culex pipiens pallens]|uniref:phospholipid scramblase 2-like isoform X7 n=1 Tax=Culex pipiens pallens TaxID=42434 RepID=UPI0019531783|nr:phospholipid scramblase 2-like isoform X7 [Culex pipiens pallens]
MKPSMDRYVSTISLYREDSDSSPEGSATRSSSKSRSYKRLSQLLNTFLEDKMVELGRQVRQVKAGHRCTLKGLLRFVPGMRKSSKAKGYDHLITDEERRYAIVRGESGWMTIPQGIPNCPPGLEYLTSIDQLLVHQKVELLEAFTGFETANKYTVKNTLGQKVYWAVEDTDCCTRNCCGPARPFDMKVLDFYQNEVLHFNRPLRCQSCCFPCCLQELEVSAPPGNVIGTVEQNWSIFTPQFSIKDTSGNTVLRIEGPFCTFSICGDVEFKVVTTNGDQVGKISKQWSGIAREMFTDADHFGINFPMDLDVRVKATLLGALFLIDYMFFEKKGNAEQDRPGML